MISFLIGILKRAFALVIAVLVSTALFVVLPIIQYKNLHMPLKQVKQYEIAKVETILPQKRQNKPKPKPQELKPQTNMEAPKSISRSRFAMDLAPGVGGGGVAIGAEGAGGAQVAYREGEVDQDAEPIRQVAPKYPEEAQKAGVSGLVRCLLTIDEKGDVIQVEIIESPGNYGFEQAIREAVANWKYKPAKVDGIPVRQKIEQPFKF